MTEKENIVYGIVPHPILTGQVFVRKEKETWCLPSTPVEGELSNPLATRALSRMFGQPVVAYRYVSITENKTPGRNEGIFLLDNLGNDELNQEGRWVSRDDLQHLQFNRMDHLEVIYEVLSEPEQVHQPRFRQPWENSGWFSQATSWINEVLGPLGVEIVEQPEPVKWWSLSCVLRVATTQGNVYFKVNAGQPLFMNEVSFLPFMGTLYPGSVPSVIGTDPRNGWMLLGDAGKEVGRNLSMGPKEQLIRTFAAIQLDAVHHVEELLALGCADRRPHRLLPLISPLFEDELILSKLTADEINELRNQVPKLLEMGSRLSDYSVPSTLIHGDLNLGNVVNSVDGLVFIDWTDASVAHPFLDMFIIFDESDLTLRNQLRDAYLAAWSGYEPMPRLLELWSLCEVVHAIHHAVSYQSILHHTEERSRGELGDGPGFYLRKALRFLREHG